jgi:L-alanine-DL-glutamate epimerase-like enolase superfamily enzyme
MSIVGQDREPVIRVERMEFVRVSLPLAATVFMSEQSFDTAESVFVRVAGSGLIGWGEVTSAAATTGERPDDIQRTLRAFRSREFSAGMSARALRRAGERALGQTPAALSALDMALLDLTARAAGVPVWSLLASEAELRSLSVSVIVSAPTAAAEVDAVEAAWRSGISRVKLKVGRADPHEEASTARAVRSRLPADAQLVLGADANEGLDFERAKALVLLAEESFDYLEQPLPRHDLAGLAMLRRTVQTPVVIDEGVGIAEDVIRHARAGAADGVMLKLQKSGTAERLMYAASEARRLGLRVGLTGKVAESGIASAALVHIGVALGGVDYGISLTCGYLSLDPALPAMTVDAGSVWPVPGPGLGVTVNEDALAGFVIHRD